MTLENQVRTPSRSKTPLVLAIILFACVVGGLAWRTARHLHRFDAVDDLARWGMIDFRDVIYFPAKAVLDGVNPYDAEQTSDPTRYRGRYPVNNFFPVYSPLLIALESPFQLLPYRVGLALYGLWNVAMILLLAWSALRFNSINASLPTVLAVASLMLLSRPGQSDFYYGQVAAPLTLFVMAAIYWSEKRPALAAIAAALATIKPTFGGPLLILLLCHRKWKPAIGGGLLGGGLAVLGFVLIFSYCSAGNPPLEVLKNNQMQLEADDGFNVWRTGFRLDSAVVVERAVGGDLAGVAKLISPLIILTASGVVLWMLSSSRVPSALAWPAVPLMLLTTLVCIFHAVYDGLLLTWVIVGLSFGKLIPPGANVRPWTRGALLALLIVPAINVFSSRQFLIALRPYLGDTLTASDGPVWNILSMTNSACLLAAWAIVLVLGFTNARTTLQAADE